MAVVLKDSIDFISSKLQAMHDLADPRTIHYPLINSAPHLFGLVALYLLFVKKIGPALMKNRQPFKIDQYIQVYNFLQVILCGSLSLSAFLDYQPFGPLNWLCEPIRWEDTPFQRSVNLRCYFYFLLKVADLLDTIFFVLRKKDKQITFLHVYHHVLMVTTTWLYIRYFPGGQAIFVGAVNCFVHSVMYAYYFYANLNKGSSDHIWWKKYITQLQMFQFASTLIHAMLVFVVPNCTYPRIIVMLYGPQNLFIFALFLEFYNKTYISKKPAAKDNKNR